jgi:glycine cleavage system H lipoate-binding protein
MAQLVYPVAGVATIHAPSHISRGEPFAWIIRDSATFAVHNNEKGIVSRINARLMEHPSLLSSDPYGEGWLIMLSGAQQTPANLKFYTADEFREFNVREVDDLAGELKKNRRSVGTTMFDGGTRIENIEKFIGEKRYNKIITRLLCPH